MRRSLLVGAALVATFSVSGCGVGLMQSARTTPAGKIDAQLAGGYVHNHMVEERGKAITNYPLQIGMRYGINDRLDLGTALFMGLGGLVDVKYNLVAPDRPLAASVMGGFGAALDPTNGAGLVHIPLRAMISYDLWSRALTPYAGLGLGMFWIVGYDAEPGGGAEMVDRTYHGDGLLLASAGVELASGNKRSFFLEYSFWRPILDDPGDGYAFADNHLFMAGTRW